MARTPEGLLVGFLEGEDGAAALEYAILATLVAVCMITALQLLGQRNRKLMRELAKVIWKA